MSAAVPLASSGDSACLPFDFARGRLRGRAKAYIAAPLALLSGLAGKPRRLSRHKQYRSARAPGEGSGHGPPHSQSTSAGHLSAYGRLEVIGYERVGRLANGSEAKRLLLFVCSRSLQVTSGPDELPVSALFEIPASSREGGFRCLGLQSYSCRLCMSRGKPYRLYP